MIYGSVRSMFALLNIAHFYPADMLLPVVRSPLGLPLGDRGLLPLLDALAALVTGVVAGGPYTVPTLKGCLIPFTGVCSRTGAHWGAFQYNSKSHILSPF